MLDAMHFVKRLGYESKAALEAGDLRGFARIMHAHWEHKKKRSTRMTNGCIDRYYELAMANGAFGGKLIGAGEGRISNVLYGRQNATTPPMHDAGLREVRFVSIFKGVAFLQTPEHFAHHRHLCYQ